MLTLGRISQALYCRYILRPLYPKILSCSPKSAYVRAGLKVAMAFAPPGPGVTRDMLMASLEFVDPEIEVSWRW